MLLEDLKSFQIWDKFSSWIRSNSKSHLKYIYPRILANDLNVNEEDCYNLLNKLVEIAYATRNLLIACPNCNHENVIDNSMVECKLECEECGDVFTPLKYYNTNLNGIVYDIDKEFFLGVIKKPINPFQYISATNEATGKGKIINLLDSKDTINNKSLEKEKEPVKMSELENKKIFISHSHKDAPIVKRLIKFLADIGVPRDKEHIFCSSYTGFGVAVGEKISDYIKREFDDNILIIFIFSENYFSSAPCLCEMGAAWIKTKGHIPIIVPPFTFEGITGFIDKDVKGINITSRSDLFEFRQAIESEFSITTSVTNWETDREDFIELVTDVINKE